MATLLQDRGYVWVHEYTPTKDAAAQEPQRRDWSDAFRLYGRFREYSTVEASAHTFAKAEAILAIIRVRTALNSEFTHVVMANHDMEMTSIDMRT